MITCHTLFILEIGNLTHPKQLVAVKKSARPSKAELTATKSNEKSDDILVRPCVRYASCKY